MNYKMIVHTVGRMLAVEAALMLLPLGVALLYGEYSALSFAIAIGVALLLGLPMMLFVKPKNQLIYAKEGFIIVSMTWVLFSIVGALPFVISGEIPSFVDALFETVSGLTTTGASILQDVTELSHGMAFWRSFAHWIGGMGVLVFLVAILPDNNTRSIHMLRAEMPGLTVDKLVPRLRNSAKILYLIYVALTVVLIVLLCCGGMSLFESAVHAFGTAGTGGFGIRGDSITSYSPYIQWVITVFMWLFGVNFNLYYLLLIRRFKPALCSTELWVYFGITVASVIGITINILPMYGAGDAIRQASFQVSSVMTTTGYATADFNLWPSFAKGVLLVLMFIGGCAGSTAGGLKVSRVLILSRMVRKELRRMLHPRSVNTVKIDGKQLDDVTLNGVGTYFAVYVFCFTAVFLMLCLEPFGLETNFTAAVACFNNVGPGFGAVGPMGNYAAFSAVSKLVLSGAMLLGRLEIYPLLLTVIPATWTKK